MKPLDQLKSVLCDPEGKCCIAGSDEDRAIVDSALKALAQPSVQEPLAWCTKSELENMAKGFSQDVPARSMRVPQLYPKEGTVLLCATPPAKPERVQEPVEPSNVKAALCFALWHHMGASSQIGQPIRKMLGLGQHDHLSAFQFSEARRINSVLDVPPATPVPLTADQREEIAKGWRGRNWSVGDIIDAVEAAHKITKGNT